MIDQDQMLQRQNQIVPLSVGKLFTVFLMSAVATIILHKLNENLNKNNTN